MGRVRGRNRKVSVGSHRPGDVWTSGRKKGQLKRSVGVKGASVGKGTSRGCCRAGGYGGGEKEEETGGGCACLHSRLAEVRSRRLRTIFKIQE